MKKKSTTTHGITLSASPSFSATIAAIFTFRSAYLFTTAPRRIGHDGTNHNVDTTTPPQTPVSEGRYPTCDGMYPHKSHQLPLAVQTSKRKKSETSGSHLVTMISIWSIVRPFPHTLDKSFAKESARFLAELRCAVSCITCSVLLWKIPEPQPTDSNAGTLETLVLK